MPSTVTKSRSPLQHVRVQAFSLVGVQTAIAALMVIAWGVSSSFAAISAMLGGVAVVVPSGWFAWRWFSNQKRNPKQLLRALVLYECGKILMSALLAMLFLTKCKVEALPFFCGFLGAYAGLLAAPLIVIKTKRMAY